MKTIQMNICPLCDEAPAVDSRRRFQVRCACGACGPKMRTEGEAIGRWNSVVSFVQKFRASMTPLAGIAA
jgi:hypothetical protein